MFSFFFNFLIILLKKSFEILVTLSNTQILWIMLIIAKLTSFLCFLFFLLLLLLFFFFFFFFDKNSSAKDSWEKYYENNIERLQKNLLKDMKVFLKKKNKKSNNIVLNDTKIYQKVKNNDLWSIEKNIIKWEEMP